MSLYSSRLRTLAAIFAVAAVLCLGGVSALAQQGGKATEPIRILVPKSTSSLPLLLLRDAARSGDLEVSVEFFVNHPQALALLLRGDTDLLFTGTSQGWANHLDGGPVIMVGTGVWGVSSFIGNLAGIETIADLKGETVALPFPGSPLDVQVRYLLQEAGIDPDRDVQIIYSAFTQTIPRLLSGQVDAAALPEPLASNLVIGKGLPRLIEIKQAWADASDGNEMSPQVSLFATSKGAAQRGQAMAKLLDLWREATEWVNANNAEAAALFAEELGFPVPVVAEALRHTLLAVPRAGENRSLVVAYYELVQQFVEGREKTLPDEFFFTP